MAHWLDLEYADRIFSILPRYSRKNTSKFKLQARCPICGDSSTDQLKARFWAYDNDDTVVFHCYNCAAHMPVYVYMKEYEPDLYREYLLEKRKHNVNPKKEEPKKEIQRAKLVVERLNFCERLDRIDPKHPIIKYVTARRIPKDKWHRLWFTTEWPKLCNSVCPGTYKAENNEPRLVIPIYNKDGKIESFQGRALVNGAPQKYITIKASEDATKIYGQDTTDGNKPVIVLEGPIDSLFLDNAIAITGGSIDLEFVPYPETRIWVQDNEPRHPDTIKRMKRLIDAGEKVCFWDKAPWKSKDINDMIKNENADPREIEEYILSNSFSGLRAKHRMNSFSKL